MKINQLCEGTYGPHQKTLSSLKRSKRTGYVLKDSGSDEIRIFNISDLTTLEGLVPADYLDKTLILDSLNLGSLKSAPRTIKGSFHAKSCDLVDLVGAPSWIGEYFVISGNAETLKGPYLTGGPTKVGVDVVCVQSPQIDSWHNIHKVFPYIGNRINFTQNTIKSHVLGLMLIEGGLKYVSGPPPRVSDILERFLTNGEPPGPRKVLECQEALIDAGFDEFAQL